MSDRKIRQLGETAEFGGCETTGAGGTLCAEATPPLARSNSIALMAASLIRIDFAFVTCAPIGPTFPGAR
jgi:hypothetical protein